MSLNPVIVNLIQIESTTWEVTVEMDVPENSDFSLTNAGSQGETLEIHANLENGTHEGPLERVLVFTRGLSDVSLKVIAYDLNNNPEGEGEINFPTGGGKS